MNFTISKDTFIRIINLFDKEGLINETFKRKVNQIKNGFSKTLILSIYREGEQVKVKEALSSGLSNSGYSVSFCRSDFYDYLYWRLAATAALDLRVLKGNSQDLENLMIEFQKLAKDKDRTVESIPYQSWRVLVRILNSCNKIFAVFGNDEKTVVFISDDKPNVCVEIENHIFEDLTRKHFQDKTTVYASKPVTIKTENKKEKKSMKMPSMNFECGPIKDSNIRFSPYGMAVSNDNGETWKSYDPVNDKTIDVTGFVFDLKGMIWKTPLAINSVAEGDMIMHNGKPVYVVAIGDTQLEVIDILASEVKTIMPITNMFGFNFVTKVTPIINFGNVKPDPNNPFGSIVPMMIMSEVFGDEGSEGFDLFDDNSDRKNPFMSLMKMSMMGNMVGGMFGGGQNPFGNLMNFGSPAQDNK